MTGNGMIEGKVCIVTAGAAGIGQATAIKFAEEGGLVAIVDLDQEMGLATLEECKKISSGNHIFIKTNVIKKSEVEAMVEKVVANFGRVDILVNCAGGFSKGYKTVEIPEDDWDLVMDLNIKSTFLACQAVIPHMIKNDGGRIVNVSSDAGRSAITLSASHYAASKAAVLGFTRHLAREVGEYNIYVNSVAPGTTLTPRIAKVRTEEFKKMAAGLSPLGRLARAEEQAEAILFLASDRASYITGATLDVSGGRIMF